MSQREDCPACNGAGTTQVPAIEYDDQSKRHDVVLTVLCPWCAGTGWVTPMMAETLRKRLEDFKNEPL